MLSNIAALRSYTGTETIIDIAGYLSDNDGGGGRFYLNSSSTDADDGFLTIVDANGSRWQREASQSAYSVQQAGVALGAADDTAAFNSMLSTLSTKFKGGEAVIPAGVWAKVASGNLTIPPNVCVRGTTPPMVTTTQGSSTTFAGATGGIMLTAPYEINPQNGSILERLQIVWPDIKTHPTESEITAAVASWLSSAGEAIHIKSSTAAPVTIRDVMIIGFKTGIHAECGQFHFENVWIDCYDGVKINNAGDIAVMINVRVEPMYAGLVSELAHYRPGKAFSFTNGGGCFATNCFTFAYHTGYYFQAASNMVMVGCAAEFINNLGYGGSIGFNFESGYSTPQSTFTGCYSNGYATNYKVMATGDLHFVNCGGTAPSDGTYSSLMTFGTGTYGEIIGGSWNVGGITGIVPFQFQDTVNHWKLTSITVTNGLPNLLYSFGGSSRDKVDILGTRVQNSSNAYMGKFANSHLHEKLILTTDAGQTPTDGQSPAPLCLNSVGSKPYSSGPLMLDIRQNNGTVGAIQMNSAGTAVTYNTTSDGRLKEDVSEISNALDLVNSLHPVEFTWSGTDCRETGFIAQELFKIIPQAVSAGDDGDIIEKRWTIDSRAIIPFLVASIQELNRKLADKP